MILLVISMLFALPPNVASHVGAALAGYPSLGAELERTCKRESRCKRLRVHKIDAHRSRASWRTGHRTGALQNWCPWHKRDHGGWSTRGAYGDVVVYVLPYLKIPCLPASVLDIPIIAAYVKAKRSVRACLGKWRACSFKARRKLWGNPVRYLKWRQTRGKSFGRHVRQQRAFFRKPLWWRIMFTWHAH